MAVFEDQCEPDASDAIGRQHRRGVKEKILQNERQDLYDCSVYDKLYHEEGSGYSMFLNRKSGTNEGRKESKL